jgi:hypothetical protein
MSARIRAGVVLGALCLFASCTSFTEPEVHPEDGFVDGPFEVTLSVAPGKVARPAVVVATLTVKNLGSEELVFGGGSGLVCIAQPLVFFGDEPIPFQATQYGCTTGTGVPIEGHNELTREWLLLLTPGHRAGVYRFVARVAARDLEATFSVR